MNFPYQFNTIPYPLWRKRWSSFSEQLLTPIWKRSYPYEADVNPLENSAQMADILHRFRLLKEMTVSEINEALISDDAWIVDARQSIIPPVLSTSDLTNVIRLPAQWEQMESVIVSWSVFYPQLWSLHAEIVESVAPVADVTVVVPDLLWANGIWVYLKQRDRLKRHAGRVRFMVCPVDDIWIRDYGPIVGYGADGGRIAFDAIYDHIPTYPQTRDDAMPLYWGKHEGIPVYRLNLHTEGGNIWSDGAGTFIMTERIFEANPKLSRDGLEAYLHQVFDFKKIIYTPRMKYETTGHVDLLLKLASADTVLISDSGVPHTDELAITAEIFRKATNADGQPYNVLKLPTPPLYRNWFFYPIRRSYTNSLTINGRVLVPVYGLKTDEEALRTYEQAMPAYQVVPIDCKVGANGGGAVHCLTKEIPAKL
jgi:agmatine deiminase